MRTLFYPLLLMLVFSCTAQHKTMEQPEHQYTNALINETSPYLLQHAHNPVNWYPWGNEAFEKARKENKLVLVSIGYAACHWCHVMERESFEDEAVAKVMNDHFVCIKVDREQRPDVDHQYMDAVQLITGQGGWPLNCFALPDGRPVWGGTYFNRRQWLSVLTQLSDLYRKEPGTLTAQAEQIQRGIRQNNLMFLSEEPPPFHKEELKQAVENWKNRFDRKWGGNKGAPKFPMPSTFRFLLNEYYHTGEILLLQQVTLSLDKMAYGGIYDQLAGGFARYATDSRWRVPHFEKMLYDNAQLIQLYSEAYKLTHKPLYKQVVYQTVDFLLRELQAPHGGFYASLDADSEGGEGNFYVWAKQETDRLLGEDAPLFNAFYSVTAAGNWEEGKNILFVENPIEKVAKNFNLTVEEAEKRLQKARQILLNARNRRPRPHTDTKVLTSWNALVVSGLITAYEAFDEPLFLETADKTARFLLSQPHIDEGHLWRERDKVPAFLDDYAFTAQAFFDLYRATFNEQWLYHAKKITDFARQHFYDKATGMFLYARQEEEPAIQAKIEITDNVIPSSNAAMALVLAQAGLYLENDNYSKTAQTMTKQIYPALLKNLPYFSHWALLLNRYLYPAREVVFIGPEALKLHRDFERNYTAVWMAGSTGKSELPLLKDRFVPGKTLIYVCENKTCKLPVTSVKEALLLLRK